MHQIGMGNVCTTEPLKNWSKFWHNSSVYLTYDVGV